MNTSDVFALSNPSRTSFQPIEEANQFEPKRRTPTTLTFKASKTIQTNESKKIEKEPFNSDFRIVEQNRQQDEVLDQEELYRNLRLIKEKESIEQSLPFQECSRSNSNCSGQSLLSDEISCLTFNSTRIQTDSHNNQLNYRLDSKQSIDSSLYNTHPHLNKHLLISSKHSPQLLIGSQLPIGVCCVLSSKSTPIKETDLSAATERIDENSPELYRIFNRIEEDQSSEQMDDRQTNLELLEIPKKTKRKNKSRSSTQSSPYLSNMNNNLSNQKLSNLITNQEQINNENKPQFRFTRYETVEEDGGNHVKLLAIDHLPAQLIFQDSQPTAQPNTNNNQKLTNLSNSNFTIIPKNKFGLINQTSNCSCNNEINNNRPDVCLECENTKKILQSNLVQLIPMNSGQKPCHSITNSNTSPLSIQISPLSAASSAHSTCSGQLNSTQTTLSSVSAQLPIITNQTVSAPVQRTGGNVFNYDAATIHQYAISLNDHARLIKLSQNENLINNNQLIDNSFKLQERATSSLSGISPDLLNQQTNLPTVRSASSCAQYNVLPSIQDQQTNQFQPVISNHSRSEQNLVSSNRFFNPMGTNFINNQSLINNQQRQQFYSQPHIHNNVTSLNQQNQFANDQNLNQINSNQPNGFRNRPYRLSFRTPSPTLLTTSSLADSNLESPSQTYVDNNDSVNIFNKYQTSSSSHFNSYFYNGPKEHDFFRKGNLKNLDFHSIII